MLPASVASGEHVSSFGTLQTGGASAGMVHFFVDSTILTIADVLEYGTI